MNLFITRSHISLLQDSDDGDSRFGLFASWNLPISAVLKEINVTIIYVVVENCVRGKDRSPSSG